MIQTGEIYCWKMGRNVRCYKIEPSTSVEKMCMDDEDQVDYGTAVNDRIKRWVLASKWTNRGSNDGRK